MTFLKRHKSEILATLVFCIVLYLFYRSLYVMVLVPPFYFFYRKIAIKENQKKYRAELNDQFKDALVSLSAALRAGYSVENAITESYGEMKMMYGDEAPICRELRIMMSRMKLGVNAETLFFEFAKKSGVEDIETFAQVFSIARRSGGDLVEIIKKTASDIAAKIETKNEIEVSITAKKFEQTIMNFMPLGIIVYISLTSGGLLDSMYGNALGILIMTICLLLYGFAFYLSRRIMDIEV